MDSFLIVKTSSIGDVIQTFPVLEYLRYRFPAARIDWVVEKNCAPLLAAHPLLDQVIPIDTHKWRKRLFHPETWREIKSLKKTLSKTPYDLLFDLQGNTKSALVTGWAKAKEKVGFGRHTVSEVPNLFVTQTRFEAPLNSDVRVRYLSLVQQRLGDRDSFSGKGITLLLTEAEKLRLETILSHPALKRSPLFMVASGSKWQNKRLEEDTLLAFLQLVDQQSHPAFIFIWGNEEERKSAERLHSCFPGRSVALGQLSLPLWQALMCRMERVIAMDSAALHLCATTPVPSFSVFGPSLASVFKPTGAQHRAVQGSCPYGKTFKERCPILRTCPTGACMRTLTPQQLFHSWLE